MKTICPTCNHTVEIADESAFRPFCSPRCKMADLGRWLGEDYRFSRPLSPDEYSLLDDDKTSEN